MKFKLAFWIYTLLGALSIVAGIVYFFQPTVMPYHQQVIGIPWDQLPEGVVLMFKASMKMTAGGFFVTGLSLLILTLVPFRQKQRWAFRAIPAIACIWSFFLFFISFSIYLKTHINAPYKLAGVIILFAITSFILSFKEWHAE